MRVEPEKVLIYENVSALGHVKEVRAYVLVRLSIVTAAPTTGTNMIRRMKAERVHQTKMLSLPHVMPGALMKMMVVTRLIPPTMLENPMMSTAKV